MVSEEGEGEFEEDVERDWVWAGEVSLVFVR